MENLVFSLNVTMPIFFLMALGFFLNKIGWISEQFAKVLNQFVFRLPLPVLVFSQLASTDFVATWDTGFVIFCFLATLGSIAVVSLFSLLVKEKAIRGEFIQGAYRSSAALLGIAYIQNIYGSAEMSALMMIGSVPLYNVMAVIVLVVTASRPASDHKGLLKSTLKGIALNPIIIAIALGLLWSVLNLPAQGIFGKVVTSVANTATPLGLMAMGATIDFRKIKGKLAPAAGAAFFKLLGLVMIFLPIASALGFRREKLVAILVMLGSATTVSSFVMAKNMGHDGTVTSSTVVLTTILSSFTLTFWIWIMKTFGLI